MKPELLNRKVSGYLVYDSDKIAKLKEENAQLVNNFNTSRQLTLDLLQKLCVCYPQKFGDTPDIEDSRSKQITQLFPLGKSVVAGGEISLFAQIFLFENRAGISFQFRDDNLGIMPQYVIDGSEVVTQHVVTELLPSTLNASLGGNEILDDHVQKLEAIDQSLIWLFEYNPDVQSTIEALGRS